MEGQLWGPNKGPVVIVLRPQGENHDHFCLATINPGQPMTMAALIKYFEDGGFEPVGHVVQDGVIVKHCMKTELVPEILSFMKLTSEERLFLLKRRAERGEPEPEPSVIEDRPAVCEHIAAVIDLWNINEEVANEVRQLTMKRLDEVTKAKEAGQ